MNTDELLRQISIPTPCPMDWDLMRGDDRARFCTSCNKHVYNLSAMTSGELVDLIRAQNGEFCGQLHQRPDGSLVTGACPQPRSQPTRRPFQFHLRFIMAAIAAFAAALGLTKFFIEVDEVATPQPVDEFAKPQQVTPADPMPTRLGGVVCIPRAVMQAIDNSQDGRHDKPTTLEGRNGGTSHQA
jgi:hypothetical protein